MICDKCGNDVDTYFRIPSGYGCIIVCTACHVDTEVYKVETNLINIQTTLNEILEDIKMIKEDIVRLKLSL